MKCSEERASGDVVEEWREWAALPDATVDLHSVGELVVDVDAGAGVGHGVGAGVDKGGREAEAVHRLGDEFVREAVERFLDVDEERVAVALGDEELREVCVWYAGGSRCEGGLVWWDDVCVHGLDSPGEAAGEGAVVEVGE